MVFVFIKESPHIRLSPLNGHQSEPIIHDARVNVAPQLVVNVPRIRRVLYKSKHGVVGIHAGLHQAQAVNQIRKGFCVCYVVITQYLKILIERYFAEEID